jgi:hypothetical protein
MDVNTLLDTFNAHPSGYFLVGFVLGFIMHGFIMHAVSAAFRNKKPSRYQGIKTNASVKRSSAVSELHEPSFDLPEAVAKTLTPGHLNGMGFDQHRNEI